MITSERNFTPWIFYISSRSSGPGGQNVNKVNTRIELHFDLDSCTVLNSEEKEKIKNTYPGRIRNNGHFIVTRQTERSQLKNKEAALSALYELIEIALKPRKKRKKTKPGTEAVAKRLEKKRKQSEKKRNRRINFEE